MTDVVNLYGLPHSLYTGRARSYLRKQGIPYREFPPSDRRFAELILPAIKRGMIPVIETTDGTIVQDTVDIIDYFETQGVPLSSYPDTPRQRAVAHLFELYAVVGLTRHAMHYRWSYLVEQEQFLLNAFGAHTAPQQAAATMAKMQSYLPMLGVDDRSIPAIEDSFHELLGSLDAHFSAYPYLLGNQPSIGDYAMFGPMFAHLGRDPVPLGIMQREAPWVFRWTERMHASDLDLVEFPDASPGYLDDDTIATTLSPVFEQIGREILPTLMACRASLVQHVLSGNARDGEPVTEKPHQRVIGFAETEFRGIPFRVGVQPYFFYLWQRLIDAATGEDDVARFFAQHGLDSLLSEKLPVRVERRENIEVWGAATVV